MKQSYLGLVSASVIMCLSSPLHLILLLFFFYFKHLTTAQGCYWEKLGMSVKLDLYDGVRLC